MDITSIRCASQIALLGAVTANLRAVNIVEKENELLLIFYYHELEDFEEEFPEIVATEMLSYFEGVIVNSKIIKMPYPVPLPQEGIRVYGRYEKYYD